MKRHFIRCVILMLVTALGTGVLQAVTKTESFDLDPKWDGRNNRQVPANPPLVNQDFGYSKTNHAGKAGGEIGGEFWAALQPAYYGKIIKEKTFEDSFNASGSLALLHGRSIFGWQTTCNVYIGFFNADGRDLIWRPNNFAGFRIQSINEPDGCGVEITSAASTMAG